jgi:hypothetical protein
MLFVRIVVFHRFRLYDHILIGHYLTTSTFFKLLFGVFMLLFIIKDSIPYLYLPFLLFYTLIFLAVEWLYLMTFLILVFYY